MVLEKDIKTGLIRHNYGTVNPKLCRECIEHSPKLKGKSENNEIITYDFGEVSIISTETKTSIIGFDERDLYKMYDEVNGLEWEYDNENKFDFLGVKK